MTLTLLSLAIFFCVATATAAPRHLKLPTFIPRGGGLLDSDSISPDSSDPRGGSLLDSDPSPDPNDPRVDETIKLVRSAADLLNDKGTAAYPTLRTSLEYRHGETYVFIYNLNCTILFNAASPQKEGHNTHNLTDSNGYKFHDALVSAADSEEGEKWVSYFWPKPEEEESSKKWTFAKKVVIEGEEGVVMSGFYE
ncbi:hypothetical protein TL16_g13032 [Triparma laevis f. inornata]|uniref:Single Cache domain-containing protein n=2 Tax=Triparma laevis TaxID=1534972 RepID=A0A9W7EIA2_9STRA|nr:hypothetical protein TrLO_g8639 [Triparma laevis f. longispina]GMH94907.1 hypothetical protein TL16_g13032 [Triparma laevis f. inornata]